jgi:hypothetical protein
MKNEGTQLFSGLRVSAHQETTLLAKWPVRCSDEVIAPALADRVQLGPDHRGLVPSHKAQVCSNDSSCNKGGTAIILL